MAKTNRSKSPNDGYREITDADLREIVRRGVPNDPRIKQLLARGFEVDRVMFPPDASGRWKEFSILTNHCIAIPGSTPTICPNAEPKLPKRFLPALVQRLRDLRLIRADQTIHWVGDQATLATLCDCSGIGSSKVPQERLRIVDGPIPQAILDNNTRYVASRKIAAFLRLLIEANGQPVNASDHGIRSRDIQSLPAPLQNLLERAPGKGTRLRP